jgi:hypothetical protein
MADSGSWGAILSGAACSGAALAAPPCFSPGPGAPPPGHLMPPFPEGPAEWGGSVGMHSPPGVTLGRGRGRDLGSLHFPMNPGSLHD